MQDICFLVALSEIEFYLQIRVCLSNAAVRIFILGAIPVYYLSVFYERHDNIICIFRLCFDGMFFLHKMGLAGLAVS